MKLLSKSNFGYEICFLLATEYILNFSESLYCDIYIMMVWFECVL